MLSTRAFQALSAGWNPVCRSTVPLAEKFMRESAKLDSKVRVLDGTPSILFDCYQSICYTIPRAKQKG